MTEEPPRSPEPGEGGLAARGAVPHEDMTDARALRAMAHPLRMKLLNTLVLLGTATATQLAEAVGDTPANCSWHLRQLAKYGYIEPAPGGTGRQRPWQVAVKTRSFDDDDASPEAALAGAALTDALLDFEVAALRDWDRFRPNDPPEWRSASGAMQSIEWMSPDEVEALRDDINAIFQRHIARFADPALRPPGSRPVRLVAWVVPAAPYDVAHTPDPASHDEG